MAEKVRSKDLPVSELIGLSSEAIALFDADRTFRAANAGFARLFRPITGFLKPGTPWEIVLAEAHRRDVIDEDTRRGLMLIEDRLFDQAGTDYDVIGSISGAGTYRFRLGATSDGGLALSLRIEDDPADRLAAERELEELMAKVLEACPTCLTMARIGDGHILYRSPAATELLGKGLDSRDHFVMREERADFITALLPHARVEDMRITARRADGASFPASISARLIDYRGEDVIVSSIDDLTEGLAIQEELAHQKEQVFQSEKMSALGELLAGVAHELNNPLSIVVGNGQLLLEEETDEANRRRLEKLTEAAERCVRIVRSFLSMARERPLDITAVPATRLVETAVEAFRAGGGGSVAINTAIAPDLPRLMIDKVQIVQMLSNLMTNAQHAITDAGQGGTIDIYVRPGTEPGRIVIRVADDGPGIPDAIALRIFDPLFTTKAVGKGTGIGLALCHRIVAAHKGTIRLDRDVRQGAAFVIDLPAERQDG